jgi:hypothetical protein
LQQTQEPSSEHQLQEPPSGTQEKKKRRKKKKKEKEKRLKMEDFEDVNDWINYERDLME